MAVGWKAVSAKRCNGISRDMLTINGETRPRDKN